MFLFLFFFFFKQKTAYELRISDWSSDVCSSDLLVVKRRRLERYPQPRRGLAIVLVDDHHILALVAEQKFEFAILLRLEPRRAAQEAAKGQEIMRGQRRDRKSVV